MDDDDDLAADLEALWEAPAAGVATDPDEVTLIPLGPGATSRAPYPATTPSTVVEPSGWRAAGRSWDTAACRLAAEGRPAWWRRHPHADEIARLRRRADAARRTGKALDALHSVGYVVLHDRILDGTATVIDHIAAGPAGLLVVAAHPVTRLHRDETGLLYDDGKAVLAESAALGRLTDQFLDGVVRHLPGWTLAAYAALSLVGPAATGWPAWMGAGEPAALLTPTQLGWWAGNLGAPLAPIHVADLALAVTAACPPAQTC